MRPETYAHALIHLLEKGEHPAQAVKKLHAALEVEGRAALMPAIGRAFERLAAKEARKNQSLLMVARKKDEAAARKQSGASADAEVVLDESLIGGWRLEEGEKLHDASWKHHLLTMYHNATRA